jgi:hypothetical protein
MFATKFTGSANAGKVMHFLGGRDVKTVGASLEQLAFKAVQGAGETRIAAAAGVPAAGAAAAARAAAGDSRKAASSLVLAAALAADTAAAGGTAIDAGRTRAWINPGSTATKHCPTQS